MSRAQSSPKNKSFRDRSRWKHKICYIVSMTTALKKQIQKMARESVREAFREEMTLMHAVGLDDTVIFNAWRDNGGKPVPVEKFIRVLKKLERKDRGVLK